MEFQKYILSLLMIFCISNFSLNAQSPSPPQKQTIVLTGGAIHTGNGQVIENGMLRFENGKITFVGTAGEFIPDDNTQKFDVTGKHIYPGLIAVNTTLGLTEVESVRATRDFDEAGDLNPNVRAIIAYNADSRIIPTLRSNGILLAQITPQGGRISGQSSIVQLDAWNWEDAAYQKDGGVHLNWPSRFTVTGWWAQPGGINANEKYDEQVTAVYDYFSEAKAYSLSAPAIVNQRFHALKGLFNGLKKLFIQVNETREISDALEFGKKFGLSIVIVGGRDAGMLADKLKVQNVPVMVQSLFELPASQDDDIDVLFKLPALLKNAGVEFCLSIRKTWDQRNLPFVAGATVAHGLTKEEALAAITSSVAKILGIDKTTGSLEVGKDANIIVSSGDVLDMRTSKIELAFIQGRKVDLDDPHKQLYRKFKEKYQN